MVLTFCAVENSSPTPPPDTIAWSNAKASKQLITNDYNVHNLGVMAHPARPGTTGLRLKQPKRLKLWLKGEEEPK